MLTMGVDVSLPASSTSSSLQPEALVLIMELDGQVEFEGQVVQKDVLKARLRRLVAEDRGRPILLRADSSISYGRVVAMVDLVRKVGFTKIGLITRLPVNPV